MTKEKLVVIDGLIEKGLNNLEIYNHNICKRYLLDMWIKRLKEKGLDECISML